MKIGGNAIIRQDCRLFGCNAKAVSLINECGMSFAPSTFDVKTEEYPLSRPSFSLFGEVACAVVCGRAIGFFPVPGCPSHR